MVNLLPALTHAPQPHAPTPLCRCRVLYLGSAVPTVSKDGLHGIQEPLHKLCVNSSPDTKGVDTWLSVWSNGLLLEPIDSQNNNDIDANRDVIFFPIISLHYCSAVRYSKVILPKNADPFGSCNLNITERFLPLDSPYANHPDSPHPPIFAALLRKSTGVRIIECHAFICTSSSVANSLVRSCFHAYADSVMIKIDDKRILDKAVSEANRNVSASTNTGQNGSKPTLTLKKSNSSSLSDHSTTSTTTSAKLTSKIRLRLPNAISWTSKRKELAAWQKRQQNGQHDSDVLSVCSSNLSHHISNAVCVSQNDAYKHTNRNHLRETFGSSSSKLSANHRHSLPFTLNNHAELYSTWKNGLRLIENRPSHLAPNFNAAQMFQPTNLAGQMQFVPFLQPLHALPPSIVYVSPQSQKPKPVPRKSKASNANNCSRPSSVMAYPSQPSQSQQIQLLKSLMPPSYDQIYASAIYNPYPRPLSVMANHASCGYPEDARVVRRGTVTAASLANVSAATYSHPAKNHDRHSYAGGSISSYDSVTNGRCSYKDRVSGPAYPSNVSQSGTVTPRPLANSNLLMTTNIPPTSRSKVRKRPVIAKRSASTDRTADVYRNERPSYRNGIPQIYYNSTANVSSFHQDSVASKYRSLDHMHTKGLRRVNENLAYSSSGYSTDSPPIDEYRNRNGNRQTRKTPHEKSFQKFIGH